MRGMRLGIDLGGRNLLGIVSVLAQTGTPALAVTSSSYSGGTATFVITYITGAGITGRVDYSINSGAYAGTATITANPSAGNATITVPINAALQSTTPSFVFTLKNSSTSALLATSAAYTGLVIPDTIAPTLSSATGTQTGSTTGTSTVSTNEANGTLYAFLSTSSTPPTAANLRAGTGAVSSASQAVTATGTQTVNWSGLTAFTTYYTHWLHRDAAGNDSAIVSGTGFTTTAASVSNSLLFVGDMQAGTTDSLLLSGDMQSGADHLAFEGAF